MQRGLDERDHPDHVDHVQVGVHEEHSVENDPSQAAIGAQTCLRNGKSIWSMCFFNKGTSSFNIK